MVTPRIVRCPYAIVVMVMSPAGRLGRYAVLGTIDMR